MPKATLFAFILLTLTLTYAQNTEQNFEKFPVLIANETSPDLNSVWLQDFDSESFSLYGTNFVKPYLKPSYWRVWYRKLDPITFETVYSVDRNHTASSIALFYGGYVIDFNSTRDSLMVHQFNFEHNLSLPSFKISDDPKASVMSRDTQGDLVYITLKKASSIEIITFKVGETSMRKSVSIPIRISSDFETQPKTIVSGGVLPKNQLFAVIKDGRNLYQIMIDLETGTYSLSAGSNYGVYITCSPYVTNKYYGSFCIDRSLKTTDYYITRNGSKKLERLFWLSNYNHFDGLYTYGDYLVTVSWDGNESYEFWDLDTMSSVKGKTVFIVGNKNFVFNTPFQSQSGDIYVLSYTKVTSQPIHAVRLGVLLSQNSSNMTAGFDEDQMIQNFLA